MREIKFKAWDNVAQKMYSVGGETDVHFYLDSGGIKAEKFFETIHYTPEGGSDVCGDSETLEHLIYLQYTGLKDQNGVEIYEGDIVDPGHADEKLIVVTIGEQEHYEDYGGVFIYYGCNLIVSSGYPIGVKHDYKIVGNIFQNPELLEEIK